MRNRTLLLSRTFLIVTSVFSAGISCFLFAVPTAFATMYAPGATLDPACVPTDANCGVESNVASATAGQVPYYATNGNVLAATSTMTILSSGNVGIGTTNPITQFNVAGKNPALVGSIATAAGNQSIATQGRYAYVINDTTNVLKVFDLSDPTNLTNIASVSTGASSNQIVVQGDFAYVTTGSGLQIFDVSSPSNPVSLGTVSTGGGSFDLAVQGRYAYVDNGGTVYVVDVSNPSVPVVIGSVGGVGSTKGVSVQGRYVYVATFGLGSASSLKIIDVANPSSPVMVGSLSFGNSFMNIAVQGRYAYVGMYNDTEVGIIDVSNPSVPVAVGFIPVANRPVSIFPQGRYVYVTCSSHNIIPCNNNLNVVDVSNPAAPVTVGSAATDDQGVSLNDLSVQGRYAYVASDVGTIQTFDLGGAYIQQLEAGGIEAGTLNLRTNLQVNNDADIRGGLIVGKDMQVTGAFSVTSSTTPSGYSSFVINPGGNVGIGTTSPWAQLSVNPTASNGLAPSFVIGSSTRTSFIVTNSGNVGIGTTNATSPLTITTVNDGRYAFSIWDHTLAQTDSTQLEGFQIAIDAASTTLSSPLNEFVIQTNRSSDAIHFLPNKTEAMTILGTGNVGVGTTSPIAKFSIQNSTSDTANQPLFVIASSSATFATTTLFSVSNKGDVTVNGSSGSTCTIGNGSGGTSCTSDARLKTNIALIVDPLKSIEQIRGVTFTWADPTKDQSQFIGVIAQDVQKVFPQAVATTADGFLSVDYGALVAPLIEAVKELAQEVSGFADTFTTKHLCVSDDSGAKTCVTKAQLDTILNQNNQAGIQSS